MSAASTAPARHQNSLSTPDLIHWESCCYPGEALCGWDLNGDDEIFDTATCGVCIDLYDSGLDCADIRRRQLN